MLPRGCLPHHTQRSDARVRDVDLAQHSTQQPRPRRASSAVEGLEVHGEVHRVHSQTYGPWPVPQTDCPQQTTAAPPRTKHGRRPLRLLLAAVASRTQHQEQRKLNTPRREFHRPRPATRSWRHASTTISASHLVLQPETHLHRGGSGKQHKIRIKSLPPKDQLRGRESVSCQWEHGLSVRRHEVPKLTP